MYTNCIKPKSLHLQHIRVLSNVCKCIFQKDPSKLDNYGKILFHGKGYDRWFDKSFTLCIGNNGRVSFDRF